MMAMESAGREKLPYLMLADRANAQVWIAMRHGVKTWFLCDHRQMTEGLLAGINIIELAVVLVLILMGLLRWHSNAAFVLLYTIILGYCMFNSLVTLLKINLACEKQARATHDAKVEGQVNRRFDAEADLNFLDDLIAELTLWDKPATLFGIAINQRTLFFLRAYAVAGVGAGVQLLTV